MPTEEERRGIKDPETTGGGVVQKDRRKDVDNRPTSNRGPGPGRVVIVPGRWGALRGAGGGRADGWRRCCCRPFVACGPLSALSAGQSACGCKGRCWGRRDQRRLVPSPPLLSASHHSNRPLVSPPSFPWLAEPIPLGGSSELPKRVQVLIRAVRSRLVCSWP
jgi:hypothetical protein